MRRIWFADQFFKKCPEVNHGLAQVFCVGLPSHLAKRAFMACAVIVENLWMIHGDVRSTLFKITHRIAASSHHVPQQLVGFRNRAAGTVNEPRLDSAPRFDKTCTIARSKRPDMQALYSISALVERHFCLPAAPAFFHGTSVLSATKLRA